MILALYAALALAPLGLWAETLVVEKSLALEAGRLEYRIAESPIISGSETVFADSVKLNPGLDYQLDAKQGILSLNSLPEFSFLHVSFLLVPPELVGRRYLYEVLDPSDSLFQTLTPRKRPWLAEDGKLAVTGSKTFALSFSETAELDLRQSLFVKLDGELSRNVNISGQLSDSQSKLTPEGDSKELTSLDKVFIRVYGKEYEIAMGDLDWKFAGTRYLNYQTNIEGLNAWYRQRLFLQAGYTAAGGKPAYLKIPILDGKQGPYYLNPTGFQTTHLIIAGSEQLFRNGELLERGTDYYIDYSDGSVMFRSLVVSTDLINAFFQYSDEYYRQGTLFNSSKLELLPGLTLSHHFIHQSDAKDDPLLFAFTETDLDSLRMAGDRIVWGEGAVQTEPGLGNYRLLVTEDGVEYFQYADAASDTLADYNVTFSYVAPGNGDYEEYSYGKYRYLGPGLGAWLPLKRLIPALRRSNADLRLEYRITDFQLGAEGLLSLNDKNTFSALDDQDNLSGLLYAWGLWKNSAGDQADFLQLDYERRWDNAYLFTQSLGGEQDFDLALLERADSLGQQQFNLTLGTGRWPLWRPRLSLHYRDVEGKFVQRALRLQSKSQAKGPLPALQLLSTLALQTYPADQNKSSLVQYHDLNANWQRRWLGLILLGTYNSLDYEEPGGNNQGTRYLRLNPQLALGDAKTSLTQISYSWDDSSLQNPNWQNIASSQTYSLKNTTTTANHTLNLDVTHRKQELATGENNQYNLATARSSHNFFKQAVMLMTTYQLNQTEFFPKIRELDYVGSGLGLYDSTGVYTPDGDYDYLYVTSSEGTLSTELNAQLSLYLKPGNLFPRWNFAHADLIAQGTEQRPEMKDWRSFLFLPNSAFLPDTTIYGKQNFSNTLWLDLIPNRLLGNLSLEYERNLDNRYQSQSRASELTRGAEIDLKQFLGNNYNLQYELADEQDSRYQSTIRKHTLALLTQRNLSSSQLLTLELDGIREEGKRQTEAKGYRLSSIGLRPGWRSVWGKKGRLSGNLGLRYNQREGNDFMAFLPEKRDGLLLDWKLSATYRLNDFSSASLDYSGNSYPDQNIRHNLKLEFKAEL